MVIRGTTKCAHPFSSSFAEQHQFRIGYRVCQLNARSGLYSQNLAETLEFTAASVQHEAVAKEKESDAGRKEALQNPPLRVIELRSPGGNQLNLFDKTSGFRGSHRPVAVRLVILVFLLLGLSSSIHAQGGIRVGAGDVTNLNDGTIDLDCGTLTVEGEFNMGTGMLMNVGAINIDGGTLNGDNGTIYISGDWLNTGGTFDGGTSDVTWNTDCSTGTINVSGNNDFHNFTVQTSTGREIRFAGGATQTFAGTLNMNGDALVVEGGGLLRISSSGGPTNFVVNGPYNIFAVNVSDNHALTPGEWIDFGQPEDFDSIDSGGNSRWFRNAPEGADSIRIKVSKSFNDGNTGEVDVTLDCNTGLPIMQTQGVSAGNPINFVVTSIDATVEGPNCRVYEETEAGYAPTYAIPPQSCHDFYR